jgi:hypothetical protein
MLVLQETLHDKIRNEIDEQEEGLEGAVLKNEDHRGIHTILRLIRRFPKEDTKQRQEKRLEVSL